MIISNIETLQHKVKHNFVFSSNLPKFIYLKVIIKVFVKKFREHDGLFLLLFVPPHLLSRVCIEFADRKLKVKKCLQIMEIIKDIAFRNFIKISLYEVSVFRSPQFRSAFLC